MKTRAVVVAVASLFLAACGAEVEPKFLVEDLTILGVRAEPPEAAPGAQVALDVLTADPAGAGRTVAHDWFLCDVDPTSGSSSCSDEARLTPIGSGDAIVFTIPEGVLDQLPPEMQASGFDAFIAVRAIAGADETPFAVKRVRISTSPTPNANPAIASFDIPEAVGGGIPPSCNRNPVYFGLPPECEDGGPLRVEAGGKVDIEAGAVEESHQEYVDSLGENAVEEMKFAWFVSAGSVDAAVTWEDEGGAASSTWEAPSKEETVATLWVVMRDGRGGIDWRTLTVETDD